jgi:hypothetical protein
VTTWKASLIRADWSLALRWVVATSVGWVIGFAICEALNATLDFLAHPPTDGAVIGIAIGIGQWLALDHRINRSRWWILASIVGFGVGKEVGDLVAQAGSGAVGSGLAGLALGTSLGSAQWLVLRRYVEAARWWIVASAIAWAIGWSIIASVGTEAAGGSISMAFVIGAIGAGVAGGITAAALVWLGRADVAPTRGEG